MMRSCSGLHLAAAATAALALAGCARMGFQESHVDRTVLNSYSKEIPTDSLLLDFERSGTQVTFDFWWEDSTGAEPVAALQFISNLSNMAGPATYTPMLQTSGWFWGKKSHDSGLNRLVGIEREREPVIGPSESSCTKKESMPKRAQRLERPQGAPRG